MKGLKKLSHRLLKSSKDILSKRFLHNDIRDITLRDWDDMHRGDVKSFYKKFWRVLFRISFSLLKGKIESKLDDLYNQVFSRFGVSPNHTEKSNSLMRELRLRCDAVINKDKTLEVMANIEAETRETKQKKKGKGDTFQGILSSINLEKGNKYDMNSTSVEEFYSIMEKSNNA